MRSVRKAWSVNFNNPREWNRRCDENDWTHARLVVPPTHVRARRAFKCAVYQARENLALRIAQWVWPENDV